jgi:hypothetical protein
MMHGHEKSDPAIVAMKPANKAERSAAELVERRAEAKGNARHQSMLRTLCRVQHVTRDGRMPIIVSLMVRLDPRWEPYEGKPHVPGGGREVTRVPTATFAPCLLRSITAVISAFASMWRGTQQSR